MDKIIPLLFVAAGAAIMIWNIVAYSSLCRQLSCLRFQGKYCPKGLLVVYILLLVFFLFGYIVVGICLWSPSFRINELMVGLIFFFGSVFVLLGIQLQSSMGRSIQKSNLEITQALIAAVEARDTNLNGHSVHVANLVGRMYGYLPKEKQHAINPSDLEYAALLHDIGKLGVPEAILNKEGALDSADWIEIRKHPQIGKNILSSLDGFGEISDWILYHHECCDGNGYLGLSFGQIPYPSRIIAVADTYSAITMKRSYRAAKSYEQAAEILREASGTQLDPEIVELFLRIPKEEIALCQVALESREVCSLPQRDEKKSLP